MPSSNKTRAQFIEDYMVRAVRNGADPEKAREEATRMADRSERLGHIGSGVQEESGVQEDEFRTAAYPPGPDPTTYDDMNPSGMMWRPSRTQSPEDPDHDLVISFGLGMEEDPSISPEELQRKRFEQTRSGRPMENLKQVLFGAVPDSVAGAGAVAGAAHVGSGQSAREIRLAGDAADVSDIYNTHLDKKYGQAFAKMGHGAQQSMRGLDRLDYTPDVSPDGSMITAADPHRTSPAPGHLGGSERAMRARVGKQDEILRAAQEAEVVSSARVGDNWDSRFGSKVAGEMEDVPYKNVSAIEQENLKRGMKDVSEGMDNKALGKAQMDRLRKIGEAAVDTAKVGPWLAAIEAFDLGLLIPMMAMENYQRIKDPAEQIRFFALDGVERPLRPGDLSAGGIDWLSDSANGSAVDGMFAEGVLGYDLYQKIVRGEEESLLAEAQMAHDKLEKWTPSREQIRSLTGG